MFGATGTRDVSACTRRRLQPLHEQPHHCTEHLVGGLLHGTSIVLCIVCWGSDWWPVCVVLWGFVAWMNHAALARLHEAAHGMLTRSRLANELLGMAIGIASLTPLTVYRHVHARHHAHLGRRQDPEFRPYNQPGSPRWLRVLYAWLELLFGWIFTPALYSIRTARAFPSLARSLRWRLLMEWGILLGFWVALLLVVHHTKTWKWFLVGHLVPAWIAGSLQTVRKFTEHLGRMGDTVYGMTRTVVYVGPVGRAASRSQLYVDHHATHHRWARIPYHNLPLATKIVYAELDEASAKTFSNHWAAIADMLPHLLDPKIGPQWRQPKL